MIELLCRFKHYVDHKTLEGWGTTTTWETNIVDNYIPSFHHTAFISASQTIKSQILTVDKWYNIQFDAVINNTGYTSYGIATGSNNSGQIQTGGHFNFILRATDAYLTIVANITTDVDIYNLVIEDIGFTPLDVFDDGDILLNFSVKDVKEYGQETDTYSKQFKLPGTPTNNKFFKYVFNINEDGLFDFNQYTKASIVVDDITIKNGIIRLDNVIKVGNFYNYELTFYGELVGLYADVGETYLSDLDFSDINHYATAAKVVASWDYPNTIGGISYSAFTYPYICYGNSPLDGIRGSAWHENGCGLLVSDLFPAISKRYLLNKIFETYNYTYSSSVIDGSDFKKLIIPFTNDEEKLNSWYKVLRVDTYPSNGYLDNNLVIDILGNPFTYHYSDYNTGKFGPYGYTTIRAGYDGIPSRKWSVYEPNNFQYLPYPTIPAIDEFKNYNYNFQEDAYNGTSQYFNNQIPGTYKCRKTGLYKLVMKFRIISISGSVRIFADRIPPLAVSNFDNTSLPYTVTYDMVIGSDTAELVGTYTSPTNGYITIEKEIYCVKGELIAFKTVPLNNSSSHWVATTEYIEIYELGYGNGSFVDFKNVVPQDVKIKDFLSDTFKEFNLFVKADNDVPNKLIIEDYIHFYSGTTYDLTQKIDLNKEIKISSPKDFSAKEILLKYKDGDDTWNKYYDEKISDKTYGSKFLKVNDFNEEDKKEIELKVFSPTVLKNYSKDTLTDNHYQFIYSDISNYDYLEQAVAYQQKTLTTPRLLYFKIQDINSTYKKFRFEFYVVNEYPYAGHMSEPFNLSGSTDCNFETLSVTPNGIRAMMFESIWGASGGTQYNTNENLYNRYWRDYLNNYIDKNSRLVECYANLSVYDIQNIQLSDTIQIDETHYHINKIVDFSCSNKGQPTKLELLKIIDTLAEYETYTEQSFKVGSPDTSDINNNLQLLNGTISIGTNNSLNTSSLKIGNNNNGSASVLRGNNNSGDEGTIINSDNINIKSGTTNVFIVGEDGLNINKSNSTYINGMIINDGVILTNNDVVDGGNVDTDGVFNPYKFNEYHICDSGENGNDIFDIEINIIEDGGEF